MNPVVHFELPAEDTNRAADFYENTFGWQLQRLGEDMGNYIIATTAELADNGFPKEPGRINGGMFTRSEGSQHPSFVIAVDDIREHMKKIEAGGGKILGGMTPGEPDDVPGVGLVCSFVDTEGNRLSIIQPKM